jgi:hypothetical protein
LLLLLKLFFVNSQYKLYILIFSIENNYFGSLLLHDDRKIVLKKDGNFWVLM